MKRRQFRYFAFVFLSLFCGQILATPFLDCCTAMQNDGAGDHAKAHIHMAMANSDTASMPDSMPDSMPEKMADKTGNMEDTMGMDCDHRCDLCLVSCSALLPESEDVLTDVKAGLALVLPRTPSLHSLAENPFRPPIPA